MFRLIKLWIDLFKMIPLLMECILSNDEELYIRFDMEMDVIALKHNLTSDYLADYVVSPSQSSIQPL